MPAGIYFVSAGTILLFSKESLEKNLKLGTKLISFLNIHNKMFLVDMCKYIFWTITKKKDLILYFFSFSHESQF